eukprot:5306395-Alexandrium_andersonii.AAC.1
MRAVESAPARSRRSTAAGRPRALLVDRLCLLGGGGGNPARWQDTAGTQEFLAWMQFRAPEQELKQLRRNAPEPSMTQLFD